MAIIGNTYIFIHIHKTGGKSIRGMLGNPDDWGGRHVEGKQVKKYLYENQRYDLWDNAFKFSIVRNPYDWVSSTYFYIKHSRNHPDAINTKTFNYFIKWLTNEAMYQQRAPDSNKYLLQSEYVQGMDKVYRFESIDTAMIDISKKLHIKHRFLHLNKNPYHFKCQNLYGKGELKIMRDVFIIDFEKFGYTYY
jgi:hypothetical protein